MEGLKYEQITKEMLYSINEIKEIFRVGAVFTTIKKTPLKGTENIFLKDVSVLFPFPLKQKIGTVIYADCLRRLGPMKMTLRLPAYPGNSK